MRAGSAPLEALSEVHDEMCKRGYRHGRTAVAHSLLDRMREGSLLRDGSARNHRYVKKRPPEPKA